MRLLLLLLAACPGNRDTAEPYVPELLGRCAGFDPQRQPYFGDTHVHTALSLDASLQGTRLRPRDAYRFANGEEVGIQPYDADGNALRRLRIDRPLDWAMVSDHSEFLGTVTSCTDPSQPGYDHRDCALYRDNPDLAFLGLNALVSFPPGDAGYPNLCGDDGDDCVEAARNAWGEIRDAAEAAYDRTDSCRFTAFVGYEWSGSPNSLNNHRNVVFRNEVVPDLPVSYFDADRPEELWDDLRGGCTAAGTGCDVLAIPHNSNLSNGLMFGEPVEDAERAALRAEMEPLFEVFQHKGASECLPGAPTADERCGFELIGFNSLANANLDIPSAPKPADFLRDILGLGLAAEASLGENPYRLGVVASTDSHIATPGATAEGAFPGHGGAGRANRDALPDGLPDLVYFNPGGLAVVWAEENSREGIFQALRRKETYGTSGPRLVVRTFAGWGLDDLCGDPDLVGKGYAGGVPMGGVLGPRTADAPTLVVSALRDPEGVGLQVVQVVKGWREGGETRIAIVDVAGDADNEAWVDTDTCVAQGEGADALCAKWTDPDFDPAIPAFYYVRVLENPTCRWHARQCLAAEVDCAGEVPSGWEECCDDRVEDVVQERAWTSPVWYAP